MSKNYSKYNKMTKKIWEGARGGILTSMIFVGSTIGGSSAFAQSNANADHVSPVATSRTASGMHIMHRFNSPTKAGALAVQLGLDRKKVKQELKSGKPLKQILQENGIALEQLDAQGE